MYNREYIGVCCDVCVRVRVCGGGGGGGVAPYDDTLRPEVC